MARVTFMRSGLAHITATTEGTGGAAQNTTTATFDGHDIFLPLALRNYDQSFWDADAPQQ